MAAAVIMFGTACGGENAAQPLDASSSAVAEAGDEPCDPDDGSLQLAEGFCAKVVADGIGPARHLAVRDNGDIYVALQRVSEGGGVVALRDTTGDGRADVEARFGEVGGTGIGLHNGYLYFAPDTSVWRYRLGDDELAPSGQPETVVRDFPVQGQHAAKSFTFDEAGNLYVNVGAPSNACQEQMRTKGSPGQDPCPQLEQQGGIWRFDAERTGQAQMGDGTRYATGIRNAVALDWNDSQGELYVVQHGRDQLHDLWPEHFTQDESVELPAEELLRVEERADSGWPYCFYDQQQDQKVLAPEYGGDGEEVGRCADMNMPVVAFPGHWAPNDLLFYQGTQFPQRYQDGAFIAFHGSWNRAPQEQAGYKVVFVPFENGQPAGDYEVFADGFAGTEIIQSPGDATYRPMGLALGPDGALYISDSVEGRIWRITYTGS